MIEYNLDQQLFSDEGLDEKLHGMLGKLWLICLLKIWKPFVSCLTFGPLFL